ncbi:MAG: response regulator transcription factor [Prolixibacteraceae bacterium]|jgi:two-component system LytT family response regulator|nr:response regulator transcription factor [Prolixibacteraceae bacterium]MBT6005216.1 response regulator transcription factor [Prolixibacteraceae bacterium]MBT6766413.1 response regulator transcription factor [Prolixibacteraceae bacterium]MBT7000480.1 response regulator transcription factor [Prolixibacteraceae bacterium]MBT7393844.1 response regulator transcription factor [Prolixibacteraceae bacterium]
MKIKSIIVDDEKHGRENLAGILNKYCPEVNLLGESNSVETAIPLIQSQNPDLVFLDIEMPKANGFQLLEYFKDFSFEVIFVTAYDSYAIKAIRFSAADYILKPINFNHLKSAVEKVARRIQQKEENQRIKQLFRNIRQPQNPRIGLPTTDRIEFAEVNKIVRCQGEGNYTHFYFEGNKHLLVAKTLVEFEDLLQEYSFVRVHKTHLVNLKHVVAYVKSGGGMLQLSNGNEVAVSRRRKDDVLKQLKLISRS